MSSLQLADHLSRLKFDDGKARWDAGRGAHKRCLHCDSADDVKRHLCVACRTARTPFLLPLTAGGIDAENPYVLAGGYRWCQRQCSGVPLPLTYFPMRGKKCCRCANARKRGLSSGGKLAVRRPPVGASKSVAANKKKTSAAAHAAASSSPGDGPSVRRSTRLRTRPSQRQRVASPSPSPSASCAADAGAGAGAGVGAGAATATATATATASTAVVFKSPPRSVPPSMLSMSQSSVDSFLTDPGAPVSPSFCATSAARPSVQAVGASPGFRASAAALQSKPTQEVGSGDATAAPRTAQGAWAAFASNPGQPPPSSNFVSVFWPSSSAVTPAPDAGKVSGAMAAPALAPPIPAFAPSAAPLVAAPQTRMLSMPYLNAASCDPTRRQHRAPEGTGLNSALEAAIETATGATAAEGVTVTCSAAAQVAAAAAAAQSTARRSRPPGVARKPAADRAVAEDCLGLFNGMSPVPDTPVGLSFLDDLLESM